MLSLVARIVAVASSTHADISELACDARRAITRGTSTAGWPLATCVHEAPQCPSTRRRARLACVGCGAGACARVLLRRARACSHGVSRGLRRCVGAAAPHTSVAAAEVSDCELLVLRQLLERLQRTRSARRVLLAERLCTAPREGGVLRSEAARESGSFGLACAVDETCRTERRAHTHDCGRRRDAPGPEPRTKGGTAGVGVVRACSHVTRGLRSHRRGACSPCTTLASVRCPHRRRTLR
jgi:hypothetical protein